MTKLALMLLAVTAAFGQQKPIEKLAPFSTSVGNSLWPEYSTSE